MAVLVSYLMASSKPSLSSTDLKSLIPGIDTMSPRTRCEHVIEYVVKQLNAKSLKAISVFKMADSSNSGTTSQVNLETAFVKMLPNLKPEVVKEVMQAFRGKTPKDLIKREDFEAVFQDMPNA